MNRLNFTINEGLEKDLEVELETGYYPNRSELIRQALRQFLKGKHGTN